jgi:hypothetical protein
MSRSTRRKNIEFSRPKTTCNSPCTDHTRLISDHRISFSSHMSTVICRESLFHQTENDMQQQGESWVRLKQRSRNCDIPNRRPGMMSLLRISRTIIKRPHYAAVGLSNCRWSMSLAASSGPRCPSTIRGPLCPAESDLNPDGPCVQLHPQHVVGHLPQLVLGHPVENSPDFLAFCDQRLIISIAMSSRRVSEPSPLDDFETEEPYSDSYRLLGRIARRAPSPDP